jgi:DNA-binding CsgD family transcriptional regulator
MPPVSSRLRLVGRDPELATAERALEGLAEGHGISLLIVGEAGIGKTRLLSELSERARERGVAIAAGRASELEHDVPFGLVADALEERMLSSADGPLRRLSAEHRDHLAAVFTGLARPGAMVQVIADERYRVHRAVRAALELLAAREPLLLALDDVHWADSASLELLAGLLRRPPSAPVALVLASRTAQIPDGLGLALHDAERAGALHRVALAPLTWAEAETLLEPSLSEPTRRELYRESGGNPFYLEQLMRGTRRPAPPSGVVAWPALTGVPEVVAGALSEELARLPDRTRAVAHAAAVCGEPFAADLVGPVAELDDTAVLAELDGLIELDLIRAAPAPPLFRFRHPIVRRAVYESAPQAWVVGAHRRAASLLDERGAPIAARAHHVARSATPGDAEAVALLTQAGHAILTIAPGTAAGHFEDALRLLGDDDDEIGLLAALAVALATIGELDRSREVLSRLLGLIPSGEQSLMRNRLVVTMGAIDHILGRYEEAGRLLDRALDDLPEGADEEAAALLLEAAGGDYFASEWSGMYEAGERAIARSHAAGRLDFEGEGAAIASVAAGALGRVGLARARADAGAALLDALPDDQLAVHLDASFWLGVAEIHLGRYSEALHHLERGVELSRRTGQGLHLVQLHVGIASTCALTGELDRGRPHAAAAVEVARLSGIRNLVGWAEASQAWVALRAGELTEAQRAGEEVERLLPGLSTPPLAAGVCALAEARTLAGDPEHGRDGLLSAYGGSELPGLEPAFRAWGFAALTRASLGAGDVDGAHAFARRSEQAAGTLGLARDAAFAGTAMAAVLLAGARAGGDPAGGEGEPAGQGEPDGGPFGAAARVGLEAARAADEAGARLDAVAARLVAGEALAESGRRDEAVAAFERALADAQACGAAHDRDRAARGLRALGRRRAPGAGRREAGDTVLAALTERERQTAELVADRLTNREIAARLFVSEKTVERTLGRVFRRLDVTTRVDVARVVERERARGRERS